MQGLSKNEESSPERFNETAFFSAIYNTLNEKLMIIVKDNNKGLQLTQAGFAVFIKALSLNPGEIAAETIKQFAILAQTYRVQKKAKNVKINYEDAKQFSACTALALLALHRLYPKQHTKDHIIAKIKARNFARIDSADEILDFIINRERFFSCMPSKKNAINMKEVQEEVQRILENQAPGVIAGAHANWKEPEGDNVTVNLNN
jgi:hypothetical protein